MFDKYNNEIFDASNQRKVKDAARSLMDISRKLYTLGGKMEQHVEFPNLIEEFDDYILALDVLVDDVQDVKEVITSCMKDERTKFTA